MKKFLRILLACISVCLLAFATVACGLPDNDSKPTVPDPGVSGGTEDNNQGGTGGDDHGGGKDPSDDDGTKDPPEESPQKTIVRQNLRYSDGKTNFYNPDQGFYVPVTVTVTPNGVSYSQDVINEVNLYHLRMDISAFSAANAGGRDIPLTEAALDGIADLLDTLFERDKNAIVRFCYSPGFGADANREPTLDKIVGHIEQICPVVNRFPATVTALEVGLVGPWGEMHTSDIIRDPATINTLIDTFLNNTTDIPILVRTPRMIRSYLNLPDHVNADRLGMFNDGYLGSDSDIGTYDDRTEDVAFISARTERLPFGGEVTVPECPLHDIEVCLPEMYQINLSYLNEQWNDHVVAKWKNTTVTAGCAGADTSWQGKTAYEYIQAHMGYRFILTDSTFSYTDKFDNLDISLAFSSAGFGNLNKTKKAEILFVDSSNKIAFAAAVDDFGGKSEVKYFVPLSLAKGYYRVYLRLYGAKRGGEVRYALQLANGSNYNETLSANRIGEIIIA